MLALALAFGATNGDFDVVVLFSDAAREGPNPGTFESTKPEILAESEVLKKSSTDLLAALPEDLNADEPREQLQRHVHWLEHWIRRDKPQSCIHDPADILAYDLPGVMSAFDRWYETTAAPHPELANRLRRHIQSGDMASAVREGFAAWKTRVVEMFGLPDDVGTAQQHRRELEDAWSRAERRQNPGKIAPLE